MAAIDYPKLVTTLPGPKARAVIEKDNLYISQSYTRGYPLVIDHASGARLTDVDGNVFLDFTSGIAVCNTGHTHPRVVEAISGQARRFLHMSGTDFYYSAQSDLAEKLSRLAPGDTDWRVFYCNSGAEAIEAALKLSRYHAKRSRVISFLGSFHGRTMGALSLSASKVIHERGFAPLVPGISHVPYAYCYRCPYNLSYPDCDVYCVDWIREDLFKRSIPPEEVAAIFVEPIQGEGGYIVPPARFHQKLQQLCLDFEIMYVADEIQTGMGRTGRMFACEHFGVEPDIFTLAKGIASGMPPRGDDRPEQDHGLGARIPRVNVWGEPHLLHGRPGHPGSSGRRTGGKCRGHGRILQNRLGKTPAKTRDHRRRPRARPDGGHGTGHGPPEKDQGNPATGKLRQPSL